MPKQPEKVSKCLLKSDVLVRQSDLSQAAGHNVPVEQVAPETEMSTTQFIDDAIVTIEEESHSTMINSSYLGMNDTQSTQESLQSFLARPIKLAAGTFSTTDTVSTFTDFWFPGQVFGAPNANIWEDKLKGFYGIRCDFKIKMVFNSNRFQQGRYMMCWMPMCGAYRDSIGLRIVNRWNMMQHTLVQRTTMKHVEFDINSGTSAELIIPYASVDTFFPIEKIVTGVYDRMLGLLTICPYSPLVAPTGSTTVPYTLYVSLENVKLFGAVEPQSGFSKGKGVSEKESAIRNGPISGVAKKFANSFDALSGVPLIGGYALSASWIADRVSQTAAIFGYSKPNQGDSTNKMLLTNNANHSNVDGDAPVKSLSYLVKPSTVPLVGATGTSVDQMDFTFIKTIPAWYKTQAWSTTGLADDILMTETVNPAKFYTSTDGYRNYLPCGFLMTHFNTWRGSLVFIFKFAKTEFHSGRLSFEFTPTNDPLTIAPVNPSYINRQIVDIREIDEVEFVVPYINTTPWCHPNEIIGLIHVRIVDPLVAPSSVASTINIMCEMAGGRDLEFAIPSSLPITPMKALDRQSGITSSRKVSFSIGNSQVKGDDITFSSISIGDKISSLRSYLKRYTSMNPTGDTYSLNLPLLVVQPDVIFVPPAVLTAGTSWGTTDLLGRWALCFGMWSGGVRIKDVVNPGLITNPVGTVKVTTLNRNHLDEGTMPNLLSSFAFVPPKVSDTNQIALQQLNTINSAIELEIPQYTLSIGRAVNDCISYDNANVSAQRPRLESMTQVYVHVGLPRTAVVSGASVDQHLHNVYRAGADDLNLSVFISIPPVSTGENYLPNHQYCI